MHANDNAAHVCVGFIARKHALDPSNLCVVELVVGGIVQRDEIHRSLNPMVIGPEFVITGIVAESLRSDRWRIEPIGKLLDENPTGPSRERAAELREGRGIFAGRPYYSFASFL